MKQPKGLGSEGRALWKSIAEDEDLVLRADEYRVLAAACRQADVVAELEAVFAASPEYLVRGSQGQNVINPLVQEARQGRAELSRLLKALQIPDSPERAGQRSDQVSRNMAELGRLSWKSRKRGA